MPLTIQIPDKLGWVFQGDARYRGAHGGRGSAKSTTFARMALARGIADPQRILCGRELQNSLKESVHAEICSQIDTLNLGFFYEYGESFIRGREGSPAYGTEFIYKGLRNNYQSIRSLAKIKLCWLEEAEYISEESWRTLDPTIRMDGAEIWCTWNPERTDSATKKRLIDNPPPRSKIAQINWRDNPWFPEELHAVRLQDQRRDPDTYLHVWEGECITRSDAQVFRGKWHVEEFKPLPNWNGPYFGADWGFSVDPTCLIKCWIANNNLYIEREAYGYHIETRDIPELFDKLDGSRKTKIFADCARPETISALRHFGFIIEGAEKWKGSVEDGIEHIRGQYEKVIIHPSCLNTAREFQRYSYKVDRLTQEITTDIIDKDNHTIDSIRYALAKIIQRPSQGFLDMNFKGRM